MHTHARAHTQRAHTHARCAGQGSFEVATNRGGLLILRTPAAFRANTFISPSASLVVAHAPCAHALTAQQGTWRTNAPRDRHVSSLPRAALSPHVCPFAGSRLTCGCIDVDMA